MTKHCIPRGRLSGESRSVTTGPFQVRFKFHAESLNVERLRVSNSLAVARSSNSSTIDLDFVGFQSI